MASEPGVKLNRARAFAHSPSQSGREDPLCSHLEDVARRAAEYATGFGAQEEAGVTGLLHDLGKYGELFQRRLEGLERGIDHWSAGAWAALTKYRHQGIAAALAIQGHHLGLQQASKNSLARLDPQELTASHPQSLRLSESNVGNLLTALRDDGVNLADPDTLCRSMYDSSSTVSNLKVP